MTASIKGFNHDWTCLGFQYEVGKTYELPEGTLVMPCHHGFHAVYAKDPLSVFNYYEPIDKHGNLAKYAEVEQGGTVAYDWNKIVSSEITIKKEITASRLLEIHGGTSQTVIVGRQSPRTSYYHQWPHTVVVAQSSNVASYMDGCGGIQLLPDLGCKAFAFGDDTVQYVGQWGKARASGYGVTQIGAGDGAQLVAGGPKASQIALGEKSSVTNTKGGIIVGLGKDFRFRGAAGTPVAVADYGENSSAPVGFVTGIIGQGGLRPNRWYTVRKGKFVWDRKA